MEVDAFMLTSLLATHCTTFVKIKAVSRFKEKICLNRRLLVVTIQLLFVRETKNFVQFMHLCKKHIIQRCIRRVYLIFCRLYAYICDERFNNSFILHFTNHNTNPINLTAENITMMCNVLIYLRNFLLEVLTMFSVRSVKSAIRITCFLFLRF